MKKYDVIVLGLGAMGSAALYNTARRGEKVLGLERYTVAHDRGSSHGETRLIRKAYFEHPDYIPLLQRTYVLWRELQATVGQHLFDENCGLVMMGPADGNVLTDTLACAARYGLPIEPLSAPQFGDRFPMLVLPPGMSAVWDADGGILRVEQCVAAHVEAARALGAEVHQSEAVVSWEANGKRVTVDTVAGSYQANRLIVAGGAWSSALLADLGLPLHVRRKVLFWYGEKQPGTHRLGTCPAFFYDSQYGHVYGFPDVDGNGVKIGNHSGGHILESPYPQRSLLPGDKETCADAVAEFFPGLHAEPLAHAVCMYTMTPDENFVVATHPHHPQVAFAAGFSGHGFKFSPVIGEILADLALTGTTAHPIGFLGLERF